MSFVRGQTLHRFLPQRSACLASEKIVFLGEGSYAQKNRREMEMPPNPGMRMDSVAPAALQHVLAVQKYLF